MELPCACSRNLERLYCIGDYCGNPLVLLLLLLTFGDFGSGSRGCFCGNSAFVKAEVRGWISRTTGWLQLVLLYLSTALR